MFSLCTFLTLYLKKIENKCIGSLLCISINLMLQRNNIFAIACVGKYRLLHSFFDVETLTLKTKKRYKVGS